VLISSRRGLGPAAVSARREEITTQPHVP
jgi:hypothetical protein